MIRKLNAGDTRFFASILAQNLDLVTAMTSADVNDGDGMETLGRDLISRLLGDNLDRIWGWLADVSERTPEAFNREAPEFPLEVIAEIVASEDISRFFASVQVLLARGRQRG